MSDEPTYERVAEFLAWIASVFEWKLNGRRLVENYSWLLVLPVVVLASQAITLYFLDNMLTAAGGWWSASSKHPPLCSGP
jgi:hypothetical protein